MYVVGTNNLDHTTGSNVGPTIKAVALEQYRRLRDGYIFQRIALISNLQRQILV